MIRPEGYVLGFVFDMAQTRFVAVRKNRPERHAGLLNAPGGHVEPGESYADAVIREVEEETGLHILSWHKFAELVHTDRRIVCFTSFSHVPPRTMTDEEALWIPTMDVIMFPERFVSSARWLVVMASCLKDGVSVIDRRLANAQG